MRRGCGERGGLARGIWSAVAERRGDTTFAVLGGELNGGDFGQRAKTSTMLSASMSTTSPESAK